MYGLKHWNGEEAVGMPHVSELLRSPVALDWLYEPKLADKLMSQCANVTQESSGDEHWIECCLRDSSEPCRVQQQLSGTDESFQCMFLGVQQHDDSVRHASYVHAQPLVRVLTWDYFAPALQLNPHYASFVELLREPHTSLFATLSNYLIQPIDSIQREIDQFTSNHFKQ